MLCEFRFVVRFSASVNLWFASPALMLCLFVYLSVLASNVLLLDTYWCDCIAERFPSIVAPPFFLGYPQPQKFQRTRSEIIKNLTTLGSRPPISLSHPQYQFPPLHQPPTPLLNKKTFSYQGLQHIQCCIEVQRSLIQSWSLIVFLVGSGPVIMISDILGMHEIS